MTGIPGDVASREPRLVKCRGDRLAERVERVVTELETLACQLPLPGRVATIATLAERRGNSGPAVRCLTSISATEEGPMMRRSPAVVFDLRMVTTLPATSSTFRSNASLIERTVQGSDGAPRLKFTPKVTGKARPTSSTATRQEPQRERKLSRAEEGAPQHQNPSARRSPA